MRLPNLDQWWLAVLFRVKGEPSVYRCSVCGGYRRGPGIWGACPR